MEKEKEQEQVPAATAQEKIAENLQPSTVIGREEILKATSILEKYKKGKANLEQRIIDNEQWYKMRHWEQIRHDNSDGAPRPASAWLFNSIINKHADAMDNIPSPSVLPREESDEQTATELSEVVPAILEQNEYEQTYSDCWWYKLKTGTGVKGIFWNSGKADGKGDVDICKIDILNLFWEPGITDIQDSKNVFNIALADTEDIKKHYANIAGIETLGAGKNIMASEYMYDDSVDTSGKSVIVDWYYKKQTENGKVLHLVKYVNDIVLFASENLPEYSGGFYNHGQYPFVFDTMFAEEGTPCGFGYIDTMKECQLSIDQLDSDIQYNCKLSAKPRYIVSSGSGVNKEQLADFNNDFIDCVGDISNAVAQFPITNINSFAVEYRNEKITELKETSGNRDFSQGSTASGVTAASAISALQEAGNKLSRDSIKSSYRAFTKECILIIELIRQFYDVERVFRITGDNGEQGYVGFDNSGMQPVRQGEIMGVDLGERKPIFDIKVSAQKQSPYATITQNELALQLYGNGMFSPQNADAAITCIGMMDFEGKDKILQTLKQNQTLYTQVQQLQQQVMQLSQITNAATGSSLDPTGASDPQQAALMKNAGQAQ